VRLGFAAECLHGGTLKTDLRAKPAALGACGDLVGSYGGTGVVFAAACYNWKF
jgi:hypothetical protein